MWNPFKKSKEKQLKEVYQIFLYVSMNFLDIQTRPYLTNNEKRHKCYKIYTEFGQYIHDKYGQKYLEFFEEELCKRGWFDKNIIKEKNL